MADGITNSEVRLTLPQAIARWEGFGITPFNRPTRNGNPGDLEWEPWNAAAPFNATLEKTQPTVTPRFANFPTVQQGWAALNHLLESSGYRDLTIEQMVNKYAPGFENDVRSYVVYLCAKCHCKRTDTVAEVMAR